MYYYSTNNKDFKADFKEAAIQGQPPDGGLYFPAKIPVLPRDFFTGISSMSKEAVALQAVRPYVGESIPIKELERIVFETVDLNIPLVPISDQISSLELFHGPTLAFKDVGARFMSRCLGYFVKGGEKKLTVLVATSGDTGGAVANGFFDVEGVQVVILYPSGKVSKTQEVQLTTLGKNITAIEVEGNFDDCQRMVKSAFADKELNRELFLTSANSINVARWLPQQIYYFLAYQQWKDANKLPVISVPSGNFGNICAGLLAFRSGLPVHHFIAACNANDTVPQFMENGTYQARASVPTISNAMDVGAPSNFIRVLELFNHQLPELKKIMSAYTISDDETKNTIRIVSEKFGYLLDPHGAVGFAALQKYLEGQQEMKGIVLETAHPIKFYDVLEPIIQETISMPSNIEQLFHREKKATRMKADNNDLKEVLLKMNR